MIFQRKTVARRILCMDARSQHRLHQGVRDTHVSTETVPAHAVPSSFLFQLCFWVSRKQKEMEEKEGQKEGQKNKKKERKENDHNQNNIRGSLGAVAHLAAQRCHLNSTVGSARKGWHPRVSSAVVTSASVWPSACIPLATVALHPILRRAQCRWCRWQRWRGWRDATSIGPRASNSLLHR